MAKVRKMQRKVTERAPGPDIRLWTADDGVGGIDFEHDDQEVAHVLLMADRRAKQNPIVKPSPA